MAFSLSQPTSRLEQCPGCRRAYQPSEGPTHAYIGASPGCWARYGELLALEYSDSRLMRWHRLTVDAYAAQHPGVAERRTAQSVHVHLVGLHLVLERDVEPDRVVSALQRMADGRTFEWFEPPSLETKAGVDEAIAAAGPDAYGVIVRAWALEVWQAWEGYHNLVRAEAEAALTSH